MRQVLHELMVATRGRGSYVITREVAAWVRATGFQTGLATLLVRHTSASLFSLFSGMQVAELLLIGFIFCDETSKCFE